MNDNNTHNKKLTPMLKQYHELKNKVPNNVILLFRMGDFYELFYQDAIEVSAILNIALTKRNQVPMCGVPHHAANSYIGKLIQSGKRVALAEQTSEPQAGKIVDREITNIITAGTISMNYDNLLDGRKNNYIASIYNLKKSYGFSYADLTTGEFYILEFTSLDELIDEIEKINPAETIISEDQKNKLTIIDNLEIIEKELFNFDNAYVQICNFFKVKTLDGFGCGGYFAGIIAAGSLFSYLKDRLKRDFSNIKTPKTYKVNNYAQIDASSQKNLDLITPSNISTIQTRENKLSLFEVLDRTSTSMGAREIRKWILRPLMDIKEIKARQKFISELLNNPIKLDKLIEILQKIKDLERLIGKIHGKNCNARDLKMLGISLTEIKSVKSIINKFNTCLGLKDKFIEKLHNLDDITNEINSSINESPPHSIKEGGIFKDELHQELDDLRKISSQSKRWIAELQLSEKEKTGIRSLKVKYNQIFGYFIEITKPNLSLVPDHYIRKQTTVNAERFITAELKDIESKILGADEQAIELELKLFNTLKEKTITFSTKILDISSAIAQIDALSSLAETARIFDYVKPKINETGVIFIKNGRHPVIEQNLIAEKFIPNDVLVDNNVQRLIILTGPNMSGKSTYLRQIALITIMAQIGSFVPARQAEIGIVDRIFTRVGASDDLARGQSTFMMEMTETATIINCATDKSLIILDEIGRGTSTFDGLSIAWGVAEHLHNQIKARTIFATHFHELTELTLELEFAKNYCVAVKEWKEEIIFLRKVVAGAADRSYGIHVAKLAGLPESILSKAKEILNKLEKSGHNLSKIVRNKIDSNISSSNEGNSNSYDINQTNLETSNIIKNNDSYFFITNQNIDNHSKPKKNTNTKDLDNDLSQKELF